MKRKRKIRKKKDEKIESLEREIRQLHASKKEDRKLIIDLQEKLFSLQQKFSSLQQPQESVDKSTTKTDQLARHVLEQKETSKTQSDNCEDTMDDHGERITDLERHQQIVDRRVDQQREKLNVLEQRARNQNERIDDLQPPAGKIFLTIVNHMQV